MTEIQGTITCDKNLRDTQEIWRRQRACLKRHRSESFETGLSALGGDEAREAALGLTKHRAGGQLIAEQGHAPRPIPPGPELDVPLLPLALALNLSLVLC